jgi:hypothetical protein
MNTSVKSILIPATLAIVLAAGGSVLWAVGKTEQRLADAHKELATLRYDAAATDADASVAERSVVQRAGGVDRDEINDAHQVRATADYWQTRYSALEPKRDAGGGISETDPTVLLFSANAAFRASEGETDRNVALRKLDAVVKTYAEVLKNNSADADASYNYEYAIRVRDALARARSMAAAKLVAAKPGLEVESDLPAGSTLHGRPGGPPAKTDMSQFKIVIPKRGEERKDDPQAGKGGVKIRKG